MAAESLGLVSNTFPLRRYGTFAIGLIFFLVVELNTIAQGSPISSALSSPLLIEEDADEPSLVALRLDDLIGAYHRSAGLRASASERRGTEGIYDLFGAGKLEQRPTRDLEDDDDDAKLDALKAELNRQAREIGGLTEKLIHDDQQIVDLRMVVCRLLRALCNNEGSPCLACPWKNLPTEPPVTTTTVATTTALPITTTDAKVTTTPTAVTTTTESTPTTSAPPPKTTTAAATTATTTHGTTTATPTTAQPSTTTVDPATTTTQSEKTTTPVTTTTAASTTTGATTTTSTISTTAVPTTTATTAAPTTTTPPTTAPTTTTLLTTTTILTTTTTTPKPTPDPEAKCDDPKPPDNGFIVGNETKLGSRCEIKCKPGFTLVGVPMMECTALWSDETHSFSYNWAPPMSAVCKANAGYVAKGKGKTKKKVPPKRGKRSVLKEPNEICLMPRLVGPCRASLPRYFFNVDSGECEPFIFGGCMGNDNNFVTHDHCHRICGSRNNKLK